LRSRRTGYERALIPPPPITGLTEPRPPDDPPPPSPDPGKTAAATERVRVFADAKDAAGLMSAVVADERFAVSLGEEGGQWFVELHDGRRGLLELIDLVVSLLDAGSLSAATLSVGRRTFALPAALGAR
jgi:hypothetical protein